MHNGCQSVHSLMKHSDERSSEIRLWLQLYSLPPYSNIQPRALLFSVTMCQALCWGLKIKQQTQLCGSFRGHRLVRGSLVQAAQLSHRKCVHRIWRRENGERKDRAGGFPQEVWAESWYMANQGQPPDTRQWVVLHPPTLNLQPPPPVLPVPGAW